MPSATKSLGKRPDQPARLARVLMRMGISIGLGAAWLGALPPAPVSAATITVTTNAERPGGTGDCTLGEAIEAANTNTAVDACPAGTTNDTIVLASGATYTLTTGTNDGYGPSAFVITSTVMIEGNGATLAHDPTSSPLRFFNVDEAGNLTLSDITLRGGRAQGSQGTDGDSMGEDGGYGGSMIGGAVLQDAGTLTLDGVVFIDNVAQGGRGGHGFFFGIFGTHGGYGGDAHGGAIYSTGPLIVTAQGATFTGNRAIGGTGGQPSDGAGTGGGGGNATGGALVASTPQFLPGAHIHAVDNIAQGGNGGSASVTANGIGGTAFGGALYLEPETHVYLTHSRFYNNRALGGGIEPGGTAGSRSGGVASGGAIYSAGFLTITHSTVELNLAQGGSSLGGGGAIGGGILLNGTGPTAGLTLSSTQFLSNTVIGGNGTLSSTLGGLASGGAIFVTGAPLNMAASAVVSNSAIQGTNPNTTTVPNATGGGVVVGSDAAFIANTTFAHNTARQGGGLYHRLFSTGTLTLTHVTVYSNTAEAGGGIYNDDALWLANTLMAHNTGDNCAGPGPLTLLGENIQFPGSSCTTATVVDPLLGTLADHGGDTLTVDLLESSPAINLAESAYCPPTDQRTLPRPSGEACDVGAFEYEPIEILIRLWLPLVVR